MSFMEKSAMINLEKKFPLIKKINVLIKGISNYWDKYCGLYRPSNCSPVPGLRRRHSLESLHCMIYGISKKRNMLSVLPLMNTGFLGDNTKRGAFYAYTKYGRLY